MAYDPCRVRSLLLLLFPKQELADERGSYLSCTWLALYYGFGRRQHVSIWTYLYLGGEKTNENLWKINMFCENMKKILKKIHVFGEHAKETARKSICSFKIQRKHKKTLGFHWTHTENVKKIDVFDKKRKKTHGKPMFPLRIYRKHNENRCSRWKFWENAKEINLCVQRQS